MIRFQPTTSVKIAVIPPRCIRSLEERMADDMRELAFSDRNVSEETLIERGWTKPTIKRLAPVATEIARRKSIRAGGLMDKSTLFADQACERRADPQLCDILVERMTIWNRPLAYVLSAVVVFAVGFFSATVA